MVTIWTEKNRKKGRICKNIWAEKIQLHPFAMKVLRVESAELSMQSATLQTLTIVNVDLLTTNLNELHIIGSYKPSRKHCFTTPTACLSAFSVKKA